MKKLVTLILAIALVMSLSVNVFAADNTFDETATGGQTTLKFTLNAPKYTVTIPDSLNLSFGDNELEIKVEDSENLGGKSVRIGLAGTQVPDDYNSPQILDKKARGN